VRPNALGVWCALSTPSLLDFVVFVCFFSLPFGFLLLAGPITVRKLSVGAGLGGVDSYTLKHWLLGFGKVSRELQKTVADFVSWMANEIPPWAAMQALRAGRLITLEKNPGVRPVRIGETWSQLFSKIILLLTLDEPKAACAADQLCSGLEAGIEGAIHTSQIIWDQHSAEDNWGFLLNDARNAFNESNHTVMLWTVRHKWPSGCRFVFNSYRHWAVLVIRSSHGASFAVLLLSKEGVTQGYPPSRW
jgi:hypothetical protein